MKFVRQPSIPAVVQSLPSRERGLKFDVRHVQSFERWSLPSRERGLKFLAPAPLPRWLQSLPSRERGLKSIQMLPCWVNHLVAPLAGAWIEIWLEGEGLQAIAVAPLAGAWIEMIFILSRSASKVGRSPRGSVD